MSTSANHPGVVVCLQQPGNSQQLATQYQQQPATMQQVVQPQQAPIMQAAPIKNVNQVTPQQVYAPQYQPLQFHGQAPQYQPLQLHGQAPQYHGNQVSYSAQQGGVVQIAMSPGRIYQPADFNYKPNNYLALTVTLAIICGIFSVGSLFCTVPAIILSVKSKGATAAGKIKEGRRLGVCAVYLVIGAIVFALMIAIILTGAMIPVLKSCPYYGGYSCRYYRYGYGR
ncbi:uncharacterized protein LOC135331817 isoform X2 [Halichondria panicea]|uniref:uncharacterized protein LOC135331817 isoform X2 n=1 Tax=Halichondria panicea TaxID=6063 RepID=UPI00312BB1A7